MRPIALFVVQHPELSGDDTKTTDSYRSPLDELDSFADDEAQDSTIVDSDSRVH